MTFHSHISIERRRYAALIEALKLAQFALRTARQFGSGPTNSYIIAAKLADAIKDAQEVRP